MNPEDRRFLVFIRGEPTRLMDEIFPIPSPSAQREVIFRNRNGVFDFHIRITIRASPQHGNLKLLIVFQRLPLLPMSYRLCQVGGRDRPVSGVSVKLPLARTGTDSRFLPFPTSGLYPQCNPRSNCATHEGQQMIIYNTEVAFCERKLFLGRTSNRNISCETTKYQLKFYLDATSAG